MPNYCNFDMRVRGKKKDINKLIEWLGAEYSYGEYFNKDGQLYEIDYPTPKVTYDDKPTEHHFYRVFEAEADEEANIINELLDKDVETTAFIWGYCAWSVNCCMFDSPYSYYDHREKHSNSKAITLPEASRELNLDIELFSYESGCCFSEHYYIEHGEVIVNDCVEFQEFYVDGDYTYQDYLEDGFTRLSEEEFNGYEGSIYSCEHFENPEEALSDEMNWDWNYL